MTKIACIVEYLGTAYNGWQRQSHCVSVQEAVEKALSFVADSPIEIQCAGRTDSGVHATGQVIHFETDIERPVHAWFKGANTQLPRDIRITHALEVPDDFHARFSATARRYHYWINNAKVDSAIHYQRMTHIDYALDADKMHAAAQCLPGERDFTSFRAAECQSSTAMRHIDFVNVSRHGDHILIDIKANAFLHHMVRNIVGSLIPIGADEKPVEWLKSVLEARDRTLAGPTAPACGLYLMAVDYPQVPEISAIPIKPPFHHGPK